MQITKNGFPLLTGNSWLSDLLRHPNEKETHGTNRKSRKSFTPSTPQSK